MLFPKNKHKAVYKVLSEDKEASLNPTLGYSLSNNSAIIEHTLDGNANIAIFAQEGSGGNMVLTSYAMQAIKRGESLVVVDEDSSLYNEFAPVLKRDGYSLRQLNLLSPGKGERWNCLANVDESNTEVFVTANIIVSNMNRDVSVDVRGGAMYLLQALFNRICFGTDIPKSKKNIGTIYEILSSKNIEERLIELFNDETCPEAADFSIGYWEGFCYTEKVIQEEVIRVLKDELACLSDFTLRSSLVKDEMSLASIRKERRAIFLQLSDNSESYKWLTALFIRNCLEAGLERDANAIPVNYILGNLAYIGCIPGFESMMSMMPSKQVRSVFTVDALKTLQNAYGYSWEVMLANCGVWQILGAGDEATALFLSHWVPKLKKTRRFLDVGTLKRVRRKERGFVLLNGLAPDEELLAFQGNTPIIAKKPTVKESQGDAKEREE